MLTNQQPKIMGLEQAGFVSGFIHAFTHPSPNAIRCNTVSDKLTYKIS